MNLLVGLGWKRIFVIFFSIWFLIFIFTILPMLTTQASNGDSKTAERLTHALQELENLKKQNTELYELFKDINIGDLKSGDKTAIDNFQIHLTKADNIISSSQDSAYISPKEDPSQQYELYRRRIAANIQEFWSYIKSELHNLQTQVDKYDSNLVHTIGQILNLGGQHKRSLIHDVQMLEEVDGYALWREKESNDLSNIVQSRFKYLQNPADCKNARKLVCNLNKGCGYGCQLHHVVYCFMVAYGTERTLILNSKGWRYHRQGWEEVFKPISETCRDTDGGETVRNWPGSADTQILSLPIIDSISPRPPYLPLAIPEDLSHRLTRIHGDPIVWWVGQFLKYLLRPQDRTAQFIQESMTNMGFKRPIVGVHIRRTDKVGTEASFHGINEYMAAVDEYYNQLELKEHVSKRRIFLASDDPKVIHDARSKYPKYEILGNTEIAKTAAVSSRYTNTSLMGIILDIHLLSMSDYLVCTFSSQVCRVAYEIMQNFFPDASNKFKSLDDIYYYGGQNAHNRVAVLPHEAVKPGELNLQVGDLVGVAGNHWNGFSKGRNLRTQQVGLYPSFKVKDKIEVAKFPTYDTMAETSENDL